jgi:ABC-type uncharacterized transport system substrate-binding protein
MLHLVAGLALLGMSIMAVGAVVAQQPRRPYRIGVLNEAWAANHPTVEGLKAGLRELGFEEGRDVTFDIRFTEGNPQATPVAAAALVKAGLDLIFTSNEAATQAAKAATQRLPIVFTLVGDPVAAPRPAGRVEQDPGGARPGEGGRGRAPRAAQALLLAAARRADRGRRRG